MNMKLKVWGLTTGFVLTQLTSFGTGEGNNGFYCHMSRGRKSKQDGKKERVVKEEERREGGRAVRERKRRSS